ncbi:hypothetical protein Tco_1253351 [Tanacetum coccineum]
MATCHHLSGATWPASCHRRCYRSHCQTIGQRWSATVNGGQRRSTVADHREPPYRRTTVRPPRTTAGLPLE